MTEGERLARFARQVRASSLSRFQLVAAEDRCWRPAPDVMSFADHLAHLCDCDRWLLNKLRGEPTQPAIGQVGTADGSRWDEDLVTLATLGEETASWIASWSEDDLSRPIDAPPELDCPDAGTLVLRANLDHEIHHRGMVQLLLRLRECE